MKLAAVQSSFLIRCLCSIGGGRIVFKPLENMSVMIISVKMQNFISGLCLSLKSKSTWQYVTVSVMYMVCGFYGGNKLTRILAIISTGLLISLYGDSGSCFCFFAFKNHVLTLMPFYGFSVDDSWVNLQADFEKHAGNTLLLHFPWSPSGAYGVAEVRWCVPGCNICTVWVYIEAKCTGSVITDRSFTLLS